METPKNIAIGILTGLGTTAALIVAAIGIKARINSGKETNNEQNVKSPIGGPVSDKLQFGGSSSLDTSNSRNGANSKGNSGSGISRIDQGINGFMGGPSGQTGNSNGMGFPNVDNGILTKRCTDRTTELYQKPTFKVAVDVYDYSSACERSYLAKTQHKYINNSHIYSITNKVNDINGHISDFVLNPKICDSHINNWRLPAETVMALNRNAIDFMFLEATDYEPVSFPTSMSSPVDKINYLQQLGYQFYDNNGKNEIDRITSKAIGTDAGKVSFTPDELNKVTYEIRVSKTMGSWDSFPEFLHRHLDCNLGSGKLVHAAGVNLRDVDVSYRQTVLYLFNNKDMLTKGERYEAENAYIRRLFNSHGGHCDARLCKTIDDIMSKIDEIERKRSIYDIIDPQIDAINRDENLTLEEKKAQIKALEDPDTIKLLIKQERDELPIEQQINESFVDFKRSALAKAKQKVSSKNDEATMNSDPYFNGIWSQVLGLKPYNADQFSEQIRRGYDLNTTMNGLSSEFTLKKMRNFYSQKYINDIQFKNLVDNINNEGFTFKEFCYYMGITDRTKGCFKETLRQLENSDKINEDLKNNVKEILNWTNNGTEKLSAALIVTRLINFKNAYCLKLGSENIEYQNMLEAYKKYQTTNEYRLEGSKTFDIWKCEGKKIYKKLEDQAETAMDNNNAEKYESLGAELTEVATKYGINDSTLSNESAMGFDGSLENLKAITFIKQLFEEGYLSKRS